MNGTETTSPSSFLPDRPTGNLFHSLFGCFFYGAFVTKMLLLTNTRLRAWVLPIAGGTLFFALVYAWLTSALGLFQLNGLTL